MMTLQEAIDYIENYTWSTSRLGLERTIELLKRLGNPQDTLRFVHVAGTNGKGSTCAMTERILRAAGYRTGFYPSPFIEDFRERIQVNGEYITEEALARITEKVSLAADAMEDHPSQFELITAIGMLYFQEMRCDIVVLEVGMGGALDSTNVIAPPLVAVITNIGLDHTEYLGDTVEKIAKTKAGIIKPGTHAVSYKQVPSVEAVLREDCAEKGVDIHFTDEAMELSHSIDGQRFGYKGQVYELGLLGVHQLKNAAVVLEIIEQLRALGYDIGDAAVSEGLREVRWPARFEVLGRQPLFILDGGHNPQCAEALTESIRAYVADPDKGEQVTFLIGMLADKDYDTTLRMLQPYGANYVCITPESPRALSAPELAADIRRIAETAAADAVVADAAAEVTDAEVTVDAAAADAEVTDAVAADAAVADVAVVTDTDAVVTDTAADVAVADVVAEDVAAADTKQRSEPHIEICEDISQAIPIALSLSLPVIAFGSLYSAGTIRRTFRELYG